GDDADVQRAAVAGGPDADDCDRDAVDLNGAADHRRIAAELSPPCPLSQRGDDRRARPVFVRREPASERWPEAPRRAVLSPGWAGGRGEGAWEEGILMIGRATRDRCSRRHGKDIRAL